MPPIVSECSGLEADDGVGEVAVRGEARVFRQAAIADDDLGDAEARRCRVAARRLAARSLLVDVELMETISTRDPEVSRARECPLQGSRV